MARSDELSKPARRSIDSQHDAARLRVELLCVVSALALGACASRSGTTGDAAAVGGREPAVLAGTGGVAPGSAGATAAAGRAAAARAGAPSSAGRMGVSGTAGVTVASAGSGASAAGSAGMARVTGGASGMKMSGGSGGASGVTGAAGVAAAPSKKFVGNITTGGKVRSDFTQYWNQLTPENEGKWGSVEPQRDQMNWAGLDAAYQFAKKNNIPFKQHNFVWGSQQPSWLSGLSQSDQKAQVEEWIRSYCERYPDTQLIDVVNEPPPHTTPPYTAALGGAGASGYDWIVQAFRWAHQYCPNSILILNDYNTIEYANDNDHFIDIVQRIKQAGAPIDAVGAQAHAAYNIPTATVQMYLDKLATSTGLPVYISEYDINVADDNQQKTVMQSQITMFWNDEHVSGITLWGYIEGQTWETNTGLMTSDGKQRPAMAWLMDFLKH